ncbi:MFS transporter [Bradyrhizobium liaoningense]|uniref:MFS transporter n=1 Tax=Bradyrhizobium liaoningense TaxID=43992 RepID=UPI001BA8A8BB|nr:MFS transporter [Bradyrhizobium liaoningense]MBR0840394.1 MFS transporter [Bradyrhizobium liaoningense]
MLCGAAGNYITLIAARAGVSIGEAGASPSAHSLIADRFPPERRPGALAIYTSGISFGSLLAALAGGAIAQALGWRASFYMLGGAGLLCAAVFWLLIPEAARGTRSEDTPSFDQAIRHFAARRDLWHVAFAITAGATLSLSTVQYLTSYFIRTHHLKLGDAVLHVALIAGVAGAVGTYCGGFLGNRLSKVNPGAPAAAVSWAYLCAAPVFVAGILVPNPTTSTALLMLSTALQTSYFGPGFAAMHDTVTPRMRATGVAILLMVRT